jgi:hypothetical protein
MTILAIPLKHSSTAREFFEHAGEVEVPRPQECPNQLCGLKEPLWKNGSYPRQVIYWGLFFLILILRFRCKRCGKTASRPYGWLVPYRRFTCEVIAAAVEEYAGVKLTYRDVSAAVSDMALAGPEMDIRNTKLYKDMLRKHASKQPGAPGQPEGRPAHTTVFYWMAFVCRRVEVLLSQIQKELVLERKRGRTIGALPVESAVENPNAFKACTAEKRCLLHKVTCAIHTCRIWLGDGQQIWYRLRAYFLANAESRKDVLTDTPLVLSITQTFESAIF